MELNITTLRKLGVPENLEITVHAAKRLAQRNISVNDIISCIQSGEIIEYYPDDYPYPSCLILGASARKLPMHIVIGSNLKTIWIITAYYPDQTIWESDLKSRKKVNEQ